MPPTASARAEMRPALAKTFRLAVRNRRAYIERLADGQPVAALWPAEAVALALMNGRRRWSRLERALREGTGEPGVALLRSLRSRLGPLLTDGAAATGPAPVVLPSGLLPPDPAEGIRPLPGPRVLHWDVTRYCPRRCAYCYAEPLRGAAAPDATLPRERLQLIFAEAASLGAEYLLAGGAEPFLRGDLPEVLGDAQRSGLTPLVTTKHPMTEELARRLAEAGVRHISLSLDSMDPDENRLLVGSAGYPEQVRATAARLRSAGVAFSIQSVLTPRNLHSLEAVAAFAVRSGARLMQVVPFEPVRTPIAGLRNHDMELPRENLVDQIVDRLKRKFPGCRVERFEFLGTGSRADYHCDVGMTKMFFLPDGVVHRCYKLTADARLRGPDLKQVSVARAWHDPGFRHLLFPPAEDYHGTACSQCGSFRSCHHDGRCIYTALVRHGRYAAPDRDCGGPFPASAEGGASQLIPATALGAPAP
jgi:MoaA/NifB/PqqE/SkfB family radical SAM enzyme